MTEVFQIVPASGRTLGFFAVIFALLLGMTALFGFFAYASRSARFEVSDRGLRIRSALYGRTIAAEALVPEEARVVDLRSTPELQPRRRTNGIGMPGYRAGWFTLRQRDRALLFLTDATRVVHLPTREGYSLLLSVRRPEEFVRAVQGVSTREGAAGWGEVER